MPTAQEIHEDCCKAQAEGKHESLERAAVTIKFVRQLTCNHAGYEALLLPLTVCPETPRSDVLFRQCLAALSANKVRPQLPHASWFIAPCCTCLMPACNLDTSKALSSSVLLASLLPCLMSDEGEISRDLFTGCGSFNAW